MNDQAAIPPSGDIAFIFNKVRTEQAKTVSELEEDDELWAALGESPMYRVLKTYVEGLTSRLDQLEDSALDAGASVYEIGIRHVVNRLTRENLQSIITKVQTTTDAAKQRRQSGSTNP